MGHGAIGPDRTHSVFGMSPFAMSVAPSRGRERLHRLAWLESCVGSCTGACGWQVPQCAKVAAPREKRARTIRNPAGPLASRVRWWQLLYDGSCASAAMPRLAATLLRRGREALVISALAERRELTKVRGCCASSVALEEHVEQPREVRRDESHWHRERHKQAVVLVLTQPIEKRVACSGHENNQGGGTRTTKMDMNKQGGPGDRATDT